MITFLNTSADGVEYMTKAVGATLFPATAGWIGGRFMNVAGHGFGLGILIGVYSSWVTKPLNKYIDLHASASATVKLQLNAECMLKIANFVASVSVPLLLVNKYGSTALKSLNTLTGERASGLLLSKVEFNYKVGAKTMIAPLMIHYALKWGLQE